MQMSSPMKKWGEEAEKQESKSGGRKRSWETSNFSIMWEKRKRETKVSSEEEQIRMNWFCLVSNEKLWHRNRDLNLFIWYCLCKKAWAWWNNIKITHKAILFPENIDCKRQAGRKESKHKMRLGRKALKASKMGEVRDTQSKYHQREEKLRQKMTWMWNWDLWQWKKGFNNLS